MNGSNETPAAGVLPRVAAFAERSTKDDGAAGSSDDLSLPLLPETTRERVRRVLATFPSESVEFTQGQPIECEHGSDESGRWLRMQFCARCGTTVAHTARLRPSMTTITTTTFDELGWFNIDRHIWVQSKLPWVDIPAGVAVFEKGPPAPQAAK